MTEKEELHIVPGTEINYRIIRSRRRSLAIQVERNGELIARAPLRLPVNAIEDFMRTKSGWIEKKLLETAEGNRRAAKHSEPEELIRKGKEMLPGKVRYYSELMGLKPTGIKITSAKKRFGSCSYKNSLCFSLWLMDYPEEAIDYVIVHELAHIRHKNHSAEFYRLIEKYLPDYKDREKILNNTYWEN